MNKIPLKSKAKRPSFFDQSGADALVTMMLEITTELWVVKERVFTLEKVLDESGVEVRQKIENYQFSDAQSLELEAARRTYLETIMRALDANFVDRASMQQEIDDLTDDMKNNNNEK